MQMSTQQLKELARELATHASSISRDNQLWAWNEDAVVRAMTVAASVVQDAAESKEKSRKEMQEQVETMLKALAILKHIKSLEEKDMSDAPLRMSSGEASAWASGYNSALEDVKHGVTEARE